MKKFLSLACSSMMLISLVGCGSGTDTKNLTETMSRSQKKMM